MRFEILILQYLFQAPMPANKTAVDLRLPGVRSRG